MSPKDSAHSRCTIDLPNTIAPSKSEAGTIPPRDESTPASAPRTGPFVEGELTADLPITAGKSRLGPIVSGRSGDSASRS